MIVLTYDNDMYFEAEIAETLEKETYIDDRYTAWKYWGDSISLNFMRQNRTKIKDNEWRLIFSDLFYQYQDKNKKDNIQRVIHEFREELDRAEMRMNNGGIYEEWPIIDSNNYKELL